VATYRYYWKMGALGRIGIAPARRARWDNRRGGVAPAAPRVTVQFENHIWETNDEALAKGMEATEEFKRRRIMRQGASPVKAATATVGPATALGPSTALAQIVALADKLPGLPPAPDEDVAWGAFRMPERLLEVA